MKLEITAQDINEFFERERNAPVSKYQFEDQIHEAMLQGGPFLEFLTAMMHAGQDVSSIVGGFTMGLNLAYNLASKKKVVQ